MLNLLIKLTIAFKSSTKTFEAVPDSPQNETKLAPILSGLFLFELTV
jgi:hypothetical protein